MPLSSLLEKKWIPLEAQIERLRPLVEQLKGCSDLNDRLELLNAFPDVNEFLKEPSIVRTFLSGISPECEYVIKALIAIGQAHRVFHLPQESWHVAAHFRELLDALIPVEKFYSNIGGVVGYHWMMLHFLLQKEPPAVEEKIEYHPPEGIEISEETSQVHEAIYFCLEQMSSMAEIYPVGGAADRLKLFDEKTGQALPAARLMFCGRTLLEGMIADLQAREYLHYKLFGKQVCTPIAMMTSLEKNNHAEILSICKEKNWFSRPQNSMRFFCQPCVPTMDKDGKWCLKGPLQLLLKPGGHGVIWKLARDEGVFDWLFESGRKKALVRQINNPIAACDYGILAFLGIGGMNDKAFGFASCPRQVKASEGMNVLIEKKNSEGYEYLLTNIEYCNFKKFNIDDQPVEPGSPYSKFPSNTNLLFIDLKTVAHAAAQNPFPGMLVNLKKSTFQNDTGELKEEEIVRLESTMQNIADVLGQKFEGPLEKKNQLQTYLTYNTRCKTISTVKREYIVGSSLLETPEGCFLDRMKNARELLVGRCGMQVEKIEADPLSYPSFIFHYHPALGPLYSIIVQKIQAGIMHAGAELQLEIAEVLLASLDLQGSLCIRAENVMGHLDQEGHLQYSEQTGKCVLKNVKVKNLGIDRKARNIFWKNEIVRKEVCEIVLKGNGEFHAENVILPGNLYMEVPSGCRVTATMEKGVLKFVEEPLDAPSWYWDYRFLQDKQIALKQK